MDKNIITYELLNAFPGIKAFTTNRFTVPNEEAPRFTGTPEWKIKRNREKIARYLNIYPSQLIFPRQTHTNTAAVLTKLPEKELNDTDAIITNQSGICLCVQTADCVPVLLYDTEMKVIAAVHAGWRGTVGLILKKVVESLKSRYFSSPLNIKAVIGPSIGPEVYVVGDEVVNAAMKSIPNAGSTLGLSPSGKYHFNLWEANRQIMLGCGILPENIFVSAQCTYTNHDLYFSARREGIQTGRMVSGIMIMR